MKPKTNTERLGNGSDAERKCPGCHAATDPYFEARDINRHTTDDVFLYCRCTECGLVFLSNIPDQLVRFYEGGYQPIPDTLQELRAMASRERYRLEPVLQFQKSGKLLELGPWTGIFSCNAKEAGFEVTAIDMDGNCVNFLREKLGIRAIQSDDPPAAMRQLEESYDVVVMWHCLEHFSMPWEVVREASRLLKPGGVLLIAIPNIESYEFSVLGNRWTHIDAPRHLFFYPLATLETLVARFGLEAVAATTSDQLSRHLRRSSWQSWGQGLLPLPGLKRVVGAIIGRLGSAIFGNRQPGAGITAVFMKKVA